jgi:hypothetical protein
MTTLWNYEASTNGAERKLSVPYARLEDTPQEGHPALLLSLLEGTQVGGAVLSLDVPRSRAVVDFTPGKLYRWPVRNVLTYNMGAEATWGTINIGDPIYYDESATLPADVSLSLAPADVGGGANARFGTVMAVDLVDEALYPKGAGGVASTQTVGVMVRGAGA